MVRVGVRVRVSVTVMGRVWVEVRVTCVRFFIRLGLGLDNDSNPNPGYPTRNLLRMDAVAFQKRVPLGVTIGKGKNTFILSGRSTE